MSGSYDLYVHLRNSVTPCCYETLHKLSISIYQQMHADLVIGMKGSGWNWQCNLPFRPHATGWFWPRWVKRVSLKRLILSVLDKALTADVR